MAGKFLKQRAMIFRTVYFHEKNRALACEQLGGSPKNRDFGAFDVALQQGGRRMRGDVLVQRNGFDANRARCGSVRRNMAEAAIGRSVWVNSFEREGRGFRPDGLLFDVSMGELIAREILSQPGGNFGIGFERNDSPFGPDDSGSHERKEADVCANVVKGHAGPQVVNESFLHLRLADTLLHILTAAGVLTQP